MSLLLRIEMVDHRVDDPVTALGKILDLLSEHTAILVVSDHGAQRLDGAFGVNEWLIKEGLLVLNDYPKEVTPFARLSVKWEESKVWSEGGYCARIFFNVKGREPNGTIHQADYEKVREEVTARFEAIRDDEGETHGDRRLQAGGPIKDRAECSA